MKPMIKAIVTKVEGRFATIRLSGVSPGKETQNLTLGWECPRDVKVGDKGWAWYQREANRGYYKFVKEWCPNGDSV